ncbi:MAG: hypothetical protein MJZ57_02815 [Bacteroidales bacterium]|nr:hypothetical protein [Bacteroidales bacterium]
MRYRIFLCCGLFLAVLCAACHRGQKDIAPKPEAYFRIDLPEHQYERVDTTLPFTFEKSKEAKVSIQQQKDGSYWVDINYPKEDASFKFTYFHIPCADSLRNLIVQEERMVKFHYQKADDVEYDIIKDPDARLWGQIYHIKGKEVATPLQFWMTDSSSHFLRSTLYFNFTPNNDSLQPVIDYLCEDALHIVKTFEWK